MKRVFKQGLVKSTANPQTRNLGTRCFSNISRGTTPSRTSEYTVLLSGADADAFKFNFPPEIKKTTDYNDP